MSRPSKRELARALADLENIAHRVRVAINTEGISDSAESEFISLAAKALAATQEVVDQFVVAPKEELWKFQKCGFEVKVPRRRCRGHKSNGKPCCLAAKEGSVFCHNHQGQDAEWVGMNEMMERFLGGGEAQGG